MNASTVGLLAAVLVTSTLLTTLIRRFAPNLHLIDLPNDRTLHTGAVPRGGGIAIALTFLAGTGWLWTTGAIGTPLALPLLAGGAAVALVGLADDLLGHVPFWLRLALWSPAVLLALVQTGGLPSLDLGPWTLPLGWSGHVLAFVGVLWVINLYNFMDGIDGLAAGQAIITAITASAALWLTAAPLGLIIVPALLAAASAGFLVWNWPPARIFMGDVGSAFLGFVLATLALHGEATATLPLLIWALPLLPFLVDATFTLLHRIRTGAAWYEAHRTHTYQLAVQAGASHRTVTLTMLTLAAALGLLAIWAATRPQLIGTLFGLGLVATSLLWLTARRWATARLDPRRNPTTDPHETAQDPDV